jgi:RNA polymerase sigma-70 factor (ECF subfamily)
VIFGDQGVRCDRDSASTRCKTLEPTMHTLTWPDLIPHRNDLVRYARRKLMDPSLAEDLVHDVFEAVATGRAAFAGRSALRTWLVGVLKHKIVDLVRQRSGHDALPEADEEGSAELVCPQPGPEEQALHRQRLAQTLARLDRLPPGLREAFELRVLHDQPTEEVCRALQISEDNLFVRLHRARKALAA